MTGSRLAPRRKSLFSQVSLFNHFGMSTRIGVRCIRPDTDFCNGMGDGSAGIFGMETN